MTDPLSQALALHRSGDLAAAEAAYRACLPGDEARVGPSLAVLLLQQRRFDAAAALLSALVANDGDDADLRVNLSLALRNIGRNVDAELHARRATELAPQRLSGWNALGLAAFALARYADALAAFERGLELEPERSALRLHRAQCLQRLGRLREARDGFAALVARDASLLPAWRGLGDVAARLGDVADALRSREQALRRAPRDVDIAFDYGITLAQAGRHAQAATVFERLGELRRDDATLWSWLGRVRLKLGEVDAARAAFERAHGLSPDDPTIAHFRAALSGDFAGGVEADYIRTLFDDFADRFENTLVDRLGYATPQLLATLLREHDADKGDTVLDLGCGTGLMAEMLVRDGRRIDGVDLSPRMLEHAAAKGVYRSLHAREVLDFLRDGAATWDLIVAADVFVYVADLAPVFDATFGRLPSGGWFAFSIENASADATELLPSTGRYRHVPKQLVAQLDAAGFAPVIDRAVVLRQESGQPVHGTLLLARKPPVTR